MGESGCGKTSVAYTILRLLPTNGRIVGGKVMYRGQDLITMSDEEIRRIRWNKISMIFQSSLNAMNPVLRIGDQLLSALRYHKDVSKAEAEQRVISLFKLVGIDPSRRSNYPHEFSGGMNQRAMIAMSLVCNPEIIIADEPTTALDVVVQDEIIAEIMKLQKELKFSMIWISHDIATVFETCGKMLIMYGGKVMEYADTVSIFKNPRHPYTIALLASFPSIRGSKERLVSLGGAPPDLVDPPKGCPFEPRCYYAKDVCKTNSPPKIQIDNDHYSYCHFALDKGLQSIQFKGE